MEHLIQPIPGPQCCRMQSRWHCSAGKKMSALSRTHVTFTHTIFHAQLCHTHIHIHTYVRTYVRTYIHTYMHTIFSHTFTHSLSPPPLSFLPSPSPLQPLKLSIGRSWLVGLSGPLIAFSSTRGLIQVRLQFAIICFENTNAMNCWLFLQFSMLQSWNILEYLGISWNILEYQVGARSAVGVSVCDGAQPRCHTCWSKSCTFGVLSSLAADRASLESVLALGPSWPWDLHIDRTDASYDIWLLLSKQNYLWDRTTSSS